MKNLIKFKVIFLLAIFILIWVVTNTSSAQVTYTSSIGGIKTKHTYGAKSTSPIIYNSVKNYSFNPVQPQYNISIETESYYEQSRVEGLFIGFVEISVTKLDPYTKDIVDSWSTKNSVAYYTNSKSTKLTYEEFGPDGKLIQKHNHKVLSFKEDKDTYIFLLSSGEEDSSYSVLIWKDKSMVAIESETEIYLISGKYELLK